MNMVYSFLKLVTSFSNMTNWPSIRCCILFRYGKFSAGTACEDNTEVVLLMLFACLITSSMA